jgi:methionyl-tRNA formyltransferase
MTKSVDTGPIVDVELFDVPAPVTPSELLARANDAGWSLIARFFQRFSEHGAPTPMSGLAWGPRKTTRKMFQELCRIDPAIPKEEIERRLRATAMPGYRNLYLDLHGYRFRIEDSSP